jgi:hypothetical protein
MSNEILEELWKIREDLIRECGYDIHVYFQRMRELEKTIPPERFAKRPVKRRCVYPAQPVPHLAVREGKSDREPTSPTPNS